MRASPFAGILAALFALCTLGWAMSEAAADEVPCTPPTADLSDLSPARFSASQLADIKRSYGAPEVRGLRAAIDAYLAGAPGRYAARLLSGTPKSTLRNRFVLFVDERGGFGGSFLTVRFKGVPGRVYEAWVYPLASGSYELRAWRSGPCTAMQQRWLQARYGSLEAIAGG